MLYCKIMRGILANTAQFFSVILVCARRKKKYDYILATKHAVLLAN